MGMGSKRARRGDNTAETMGQVEPKQTVWSERDYGGFAEGQKKIPNGPSRTCITPNVQLRGKRSEVRGR